MKTHHRAALAVGAALVVVGVATPAAAWNCKGHMIVAAVAWRHMDQGAQDRAAALLAMNPDADKWSQKAEGLDPKEALFLQAACWPDDIKSEAGFKDPPHGQADPGANNNTGYSDTWRHREWHFKDIPFSPDHTSLVQPSDPTAQTEIERFRTTIASSGDPKTLDPLKSYDLTWLIHLVGDAHQPLHATSRYTAAKAGDTGGNDVCLVGPLNQYGQCPNLHAYWDDIFGTDRSVASADAYAEKLDMDAKAKPTAANANNTNVGSWFADGEALAEKKAYVIPIAGGLGPYDLTAQAAGAKTYRANAKAVARSQAELAGVRLADLLTANLK